MHRGTERVEPSVVQRNIGNQATLRMASALKADGPETAEGSRKLRLQRRQVLPPPVPGRVPAPAENHPAQDQGDSGTIPDVRTPPGGGRATVPEHAAGAAAQKAAADSPETSDTDAVPVVANISHSFSQPRRDGGTGSKQDSVVSGVALGSFSQPSGRTVSPFGSEFYEPAFTGIKFTFAGGQVHDLWKPGHDLPVGNKVGGRTDVPVGTRRW